MDVPVLCLGVKYQNLWEIKTNKVFQKDNNIEFFLHAKVLHDVIRQSNRVIAATVHRYTSFINFQVSVHNTTLEPNKEPTKQAH